MKITQRENGIKSLSTKNLIVISSNFSLISLSDKQFLVLKQHQKLTASEFLQTTKKLFLRLKKLIEFLIFAKEAYELFEWTKKKVPILSFKIKRWIKFRSIQNNYISIMEYEAAKGDIIEESWISRYSRLNLKDWKRKEMLFNKWRKYYNGGNYLNWRVRKLLEENCEEWGFDPNNVSRKELKKLHWLGYEINKEEINDYLEYEKLKKKGELSRNECLRLNGMINKLPEDWKQKHEINELKEVDGKCYVCDPRIGIYKGKIRPLLWKPDWKDIHEKTDYENRELKGILPQFTEGKKTFCSAYCWVRREGDNEEKIEYWSKINNERIEKKDWEFYKKNFQPNERIKILLDNYDRNRNWIDNIEKDPFYEKVIKGRSFYSRGYLIEKFGGLNSRYPRLELNDLKRICHLWYRNAERSEEFGKLAKKGELGKDYREFWNFRRARLLKSNV